MRVIDEEGNPAFGLFVKQEWEYMTVGSERHVAYSATDINGYVEFPQRAERITPLRKGLGTLRELKNVMHGYGYGPHAVVRVHGKTLTIGATFLVKWADRYHRS